MKPFISSFLSSSPSFLLLLLALYFHNEVASQRNALNFIHWLSLWFFFLKINSTLQNTTELRISRHRTPRRNNDTNLSWGLMNLKLINRTKGEHTFKAALIWDLWGRHSSQPQCTSLSNYTVSYFIEKINILLTRSL